MLHDRAGRGEHALLICLAALAALSVALLAAQIVAPQPLAFGGLTVDRLTASIAVLVAGVGAVVYRFALRYLDGEPRQRAFLRWLGVTVLAAYIFIFATNLLLLFGAWLLSSIGLHQLLTYYRDRFVAFPPARKKFLISRLGDLVLLAAIAIVWWQWATLDLNTFLARVDQPASWPAAPTAVALLVATAALTKSAQFPFHSWLPETMEAPTPVSALMHAGIINAGGVLLLHFAALLAQVPSALFLLALVGTITAVLGMLAMWAQTNVKRVLAWSTVSQMGFMMVQLGLAAFPAAILHLVGHGCYKAWSFLRTGQLPPPAAPAPKLDPRRALRLAAIGTLAALPALALAASITGFDPLHSPGELALTGIVALSLGQFWVVVFQALQRFALAAALAATVGGAFLALGLYHAAAIFYAPVLGDLPVSAGPFAWVAAVVPMVAFGVLAVVHALLPILGTTARGRAFYVHALHGFYVGAIADRFVERVWGGSPIAEVDHA